MQTIVIVGNSQTHTYGPYMITPRGYLTKYSDQVSTAGDQGWEKELTAES